MEEVKRKSYEVEHSLIDFQKLIIGEKVRGIQESKNYGVQFTDQHLAGLLCKEGNKALEFYKLESIQKLVDYQFIKTKAFLNLIMRFYVFGFLGPFILSISIETPLLQNLCYISCFMAQVFLFFFELVQFRQYGFCEYVKDFWNCIDLTQFAAFMYLFIHKLITQFSSDSVLEIIFQALILVLSINKMLYFFRIYDTGIEIYVVIKLLIDELLPFVGAAVVLMFACSKIYKVLHMGINDPENMYK